MGNLKVRSEKIVGRKNAARRAPSRGENRNWLRDLTVKSANSDGRFRIVNVYRSMPKSKLRCVVIDDDREFLEKVERWFVASCTDFEVLPFADALDAVDFLRRRPVDLVFTAYLMPQIDGLQLISIIRAFDARVPICMTSTVPMHAVAVARGATEFVSKSRLWTQLGTIVAKLSRDSAAVAA
jgi:CheY-like chemotaxis protein